MRKRILTTTPMYPTFQKIEELLEAHRPLAALQILERELSPPDALAYLRAVRAGYDRHAGLPPEYAQQVNQAYQDFETAVALLGVTDRREASSEQHAQITALHEEREKRLQALRETHQAAQVRLPDPEPAPII